MPCDDRFNYKNFCKQSISHIQQAILTIENKRNYEQLTQARQFQAWLSSKQDNANSDGTIEDLSNFLPHPISWRQLHKNTVMNISQATAKEFLATYTSFGTKVLFAFHKHIAEIKTVASGY